MRGVLDRMARAGYPPLHSLTPVQARAAYAAGSGVLEPPAPKMHRVEDFTIPARDGYAIPARLHGCEAVQRRVTRAGHAVQHATHGGREQGAGVAMVAH
jgi:hypothetical protein